MKRFVNIFLCLTLIVSMFILGGCSKKTEETSNDNTTGTHSKLLQKCLDQGYITIGTGNDIPFAFVDEGTGEAKGIEVDIIKEALSRLGVKEIKWQVMDWTVLLNELQKGSKIDMVADGLFVTEERQKVVSFTNPIYYQGEALIVAENSKISSKADLKGLNVGTVTGWAYDKELDGWVEDGSIGKKTVFSNETEAILALKQGSIDAALVDSAGAAYILKTAPDTGFKIVKDYKPEAGNVTGSAVARGNQDFLKEINAVIDEMKEDGTMAKILKDWGLPDDYNLIPANKYQTKNPE